nr:hypothetical protein Iba_chr14cCG6270 [Ipomoea batatas]
MLHPMAVTSFTTAYHHSCTPFAGKLPMPDCLAYRSWRPPPKISSLELQPLPSFAAADREGDEGRVRAASKDFGVTKGFWREKEICEYKLRGGDLFYREK